MWCVLPQACLTSQGTPQLLYLKQKKALRPYFEYSANRLSVVHTNELTFKMHLNFWILTTMSDIQNNLRHSWRSFPYRQPLGMYLNLTDMADKQDSSDTEEPLRSWCHPVTLFGPPSHVSVCDAMVTTTVTGGACDLCLTNGSFIIPHATTTSPVFIALYFKLNPQQCPSIMVAHDLYWRWWLGPREGSVWVLSGLPYLKRQFLWTRSAVSCTLNVKCSLTLGRQVIVAILFLSC